jgi:hypothetical protein
VTPADRPRHLATAVTGFVAVRALGLLVLGWWAAERGMSGHARLVRWDAQWYAGIAADGYGLTRVHPDGRQLSDYAFFPLLPGLERVVGAVSGLSLVDAGLVIGALASLAAAAALYAVGSRLYDGRVGVLLVVLWAALPIGIVQSMAYTESLFTGFAGWTLHELLARRWLGAAALAVLAGLTRPVGVAVAAAVVVAAVLAVHRGERSRGRAVVAAVLAPLGWLGYVGWVGWRTGDPLGYFAVADGWGNGFDGGAAFGRWVRDLLSGPTPALGVLVVVGVVLLLLLVVLAVRDRQPVPLLVYTVVIVAMTLGSSGYFGSKPRYLLPAFPLLLPIAVRLARVPTRWSAAGLGLMTAGASAYGAWWLLGPGPP